MDKTAEERTEAIARKFIVIEEWDIGEDLRQIITDHLTEYAEQASREKINEFIDYFELLKPVDVLGKTIRDIRNEWINRQEERHG